MLGKDLPLPELVEIPAGSFMMGSEAEHHGTTRTSGHLC